MNSRMIRIGGTMMAAMVLAACGGDDDPIVPITPATPTTQLRAIHASAETPAVDVFVNGARALAGVTFGQASSFSTIPAGATRVQVSLAGQPATAAAIDLQATLAAGRDVTAIAVGSGTSGATRLQAVVVDIRCVHRTRIVHFHRQRCGFCPRCGT